MTEPMKTDRSRAASWAAFFVAGGVLIAVGIALIYLPAALIALGALAIAAGGYIRGGEK